MREEISKKNSFESFFNEVKSTYIKTLYINYQILKLNEKRNKLKSRETLEFFKSAIQHNRPCIIFPSGRIAKRTGIQLTERPWAPTAVSLAKRYSLPIIPINIKARNSLLFYILDLFHPTLRDVSLFYETINKVNFSFDIIIGSPILPNRFSDNNYCDTEFLRLHTLSLNLSRKWTVSGLLMKNSKFFLNCSSLFPYLGVFYSKYFSFLLTYLVYNRKSLRILFYF